MGTIKEILGENYLKRFRVFHSQTLFPPDFDLLLKRHCPLCGCKLKIPLSQKIAYCPSKKHLKFIITMPKLHSIELAFGNSLSTE